MTRGYLALGAAIVLAAAIGLYVMLRADGDAPPPDHATPGQRIATDDPGKTRIPTTPPARLPKPPDPTDQTIGERRIRDHRAPEHTEPEPEVPAPTRPAPEGRRIDAHVTSTLAQKLRPSLEECAANLPPDSHGAKSRVEGEIVIAIKDHQATVTSASFQLRDFAEAVQPAIKQCLVQHTVGFAAPAGDEADLEGYPIALSLRWP